jgi:hypothetical protein
VQLHHVDFKPLFAEQNLIMTCALQGSQNWTHNGQLVRQVEGMFGQLQSDCHTRHTSGSACNEVGFMS